MPDDLKSLLVTMPSIDFSSSVIGPAVAFGSHEAHAGKSGCGAGPGGFQPGNICGGGHAGGRSHGGGHADRRRAREERHAAVVAKYPFLQGKAIGSLTTSDLTWDHMHAIERDAHTVHERSTLTARGLLHSKVETNPFHGILADERRFYEVHTLAGDLQDSRSHSDQGKAIVATDRWHNRIVKEIARDARKGQAKFGLTVAGPIVEFAGRREKLTGGRWITIETADGSYRRLYIKGGKGGHGGKVIAGGGATLEHPKTLGEIIHPGGRNESGQSESATAAHRAFTEIGKEPTADQEHAMFHWGVEGWRDWSRSISDGERRSIESYKGPEFHSINGALRSGDIPSHLADKIGHIDAAVARGRVPEDVVVWRGIKDIHAVMGVHVGDAEKLKGATFSDKAFVSTTLNHDVAEGESRLSKGALLRIKLDKGTPAAFMENLQGNVRPGATDVPRSLVHNSEVEVLLPRDRKFRISDVSRESGRVVLDVDLIHD